MDLHLSEVVNLIPPGATRLFNMSLDEANKRLLANDVQGVREISGSFALLVRDGKTVRMARSLDRPLRYFLAKRKDGPALIVSDRIDGIHGWLKAQGLADQFHPSYTRMAPAHYITEIQLVGCPDPDPTYTRFFDPVRNRFSTNLDEIGKAYISALAEEIGIWLKHLPAAAPVGVCFSGGIDSGAVFLVTYHQMLQLRMNPARLKAFTLSFGNGPDLEQAHGFLKALDLELFLEPILASPGDIRMTDTVRVLEDYKPLDVECASMGLALARGIRSRYPDWKFLIDGDGGDENLKDYPIEENPELTIRSVVNNCMLYQEGWGVGKIKHSLTYSGGLSRSYVRTYAPAQQYGFEGFSPFTRPSVVEAAEGIPFQQLTNYSVDRLYELKGEIVSRGVHALTGLMMPVYPKRRFQHGAMTRAKLREVMPAEEKVLRREFLSLYE